MTLIMSGEKHKRKHGWRAIRTIQVGFVGGFYLFLWFKTKQNKCVGTYVFCVCRHVCPTDLEVRTTFLLSSMWVLIDLWLSGWKTRAFASTQFHWPGFLVLFSWNF